MYQPPFVVDFAENPNDCLASAITSLSPDALAVLVDENTRKHCLPKLPVLGEAPVIEIPSGEKHKTIQTCELIWSKMTGLQLTRKSLLLNLGGGVIGDMGGFAAATYKRGISFINIPTTLLAQVDASMGGKLGVDFQGLKNHIGVFREPNRVIISHSFLDTLAIRELRSGFAEVIKHALIYDNRYWEGLRSTEFPHFDWKEIVRKSVDIKRQVVDADPYEDGLRKILNFGHTIGHAVETWCLENEQSLLHGEAVAIGMITEGYLAARLEGLPEASLETLISFLLSVYADLPDLPPDEDLLQLILQDKKNVGQVINFSLLSSIGECRYDRPAEVAMIREALDFYRLNRKKHAPAP